MSETTKLRISVVHEDEDGQTMSECACSWKRIPDQVELTKYFEQLVASFYSVVLK